MVAGADKRYAIGARRSLMVRTKANSGKRPAVVMDSSIMVGSDSDDEEYQPSQKRVRKTPQRREPMLLCPGCGWECAGKSSLTKHKRMCRHLLNAPNDDAREAHPAEIDVEAEVVDEEGVPFEGGMFNAEGLVIDAMENACAQLPDGARVAAAEQGDIAKTTMHVVGGVLKTMAGPIAQHLLQQGARAAEKDAAQRRRIQELEEQVQGLEARAQENEEALQNTNTTLRDVERALRDAEAKQRDTQTQLKTAKDNEKRVCRENLCCGTGIEGLALSCKVSVGLVPDVTVRAVNVALNSTATIALRCGKDGCNSAQCTDCICVQADQFARAEIDTSPVCYRCMESLPEDVVRAALAHRDKTEAATSAPLTYERRLTALKAQKEVELMQQRHSAELERAAAGHAGAEENAMDDKRRVWEVLTTGMVTPCCKSVMTTWSACCNVKCGNNECMRNSTRFCAWCDKVYTGDRAHDECGTHVAMCPYNVQGANVFIHTHRGALALHTARKAMQFDRMCDAGNVPILDGPKRYSLDYAIEEGEKIYTGELGNFQCLQNAPYWSFERATLHEQRAEVREHVLGM